VFYFQYLKNENLIYSSKEALITHNNNNNNILKKIGTKKSLSA